MAVFPQIDESSRLTPARNITISRGAVAARRCHRFGCAPNRARAEWSLTSRLTAVSARGRMPESDAERQADSARPGAEWWGDRRRASANTVAAAAAAEGKTPPAVGHQQHGCSA